MTSAQLAAPNRAGVIGTPLGHSLSPVLHRAAYAALGLSDWSYEAIECDAGGVAEFVGSLDGSWRGLSVTMPDKNAALAAADEASELACAVGAANTLVHRDGRWYADNTDVAGAITALREVGVADASGAVLLGAGGTARAMLAALRELGEDTPTVLVREPARADALRATAEALGVRPRILRGIGDPAAAAAPVLISALPPYAADAVAPLLRPGNGVVFDVLYAPWPTALVAAAVGAGRSVVGGRDLLLAQAYRQVELMTGRPAPAAAMRAALAGDR
ncbi:MAG: shikimate dehydrogenase [Mycobacteriales bacterium]